MSFEPEPEMSPEEVDDHVDETLQNNEVVLFMKGTELMPQCGYSRKALALIQNHREEVTTVNVLSALDEYRAALERHSDRETIPQTFVDGDFIGGSDILEQYQQRGDLAEKLDA
jgi:monothiol glutaredoxin